MSALSLSSQPQHSGSRSYPGAFLVALLASLLVVLLGIAGCGQGGYPGGALTLSATAVTIDAGQAITLQQTSQILPTTWQLTGATCTGASCGTITDPAGPSVIYNAPSAVSTPMQVALSGTIMGTSNQATVNITVNPAPTISGNIPSGAVGPAYTATLVGSGGTGALHLSIASGLPPGLSFNAATGVISGSPTAIGTYNFTVSLTDSSDVPDTVTTSETIVVTSATAPLAVVSGNPPNGTVGTPYSTGLAATGGVAPYTWSVVAGSGTLPPGLMLSANTGVISGLPTTAGPYLFTAQATDAAGTMAVGSFTITIGSATPTSLTIAPGSLPNGTVGVHYSATVGVTGGTSPYTCTFTGGTLPAGLNVSGCTVSGTPTVQGMVNLTVHATDSSATPLTGSGPTSITIAPAASVITIVAPGPGTLGIPYIGTITATGGTGPYTCVIDPTTLPPGLVISAGCLIIGEPTQVGTFPVGVTITDSSNPVNTITGTAPIVINPLLSTLAITSPTNDATIGSMYTGTIGVAGGTAPYTCMVTGTLPDGLVANSNCTITGTPTATGSKTVQVLATDSSTIQRSGNGPVTITVDPAPTLSFTGSLPNAVVNQSYTQTLKATGGSGTITYSLASGSTAPPGLTLNSDGTLGGTPTAVGAYSFTVTATDSETPIAQHQDLLLLLLVTYAPAPNDNALNGPYAYLFQGYDDVALGLFAYQTATAASFTADGHGVISAGEADSNHQTSPAGAQISSQNFLGSYTIAADFTGSMTLSLLNPDGTVGTTSTYALSLKAPVSPAASVGGDLIEYDNDQVAGTKGSGTLMAQTTSAFANGLSGSFAFGLQGDTPCLPTCTIGLVAGPAAAAGSITIANGDITAGQSDAGIATTPYTSEPVSGTASTTADANGRLTLTMTTADTPTTYPTHFAVYMVDATHLFLVSTDNHSSNVLLAGTAQAQTSTSFTNSTAMNGPFVGYENSPTNPGLLGTTLDHVLNLTTATVFRTVADGAGNCNTTNFDQEGLTGLINGLTGIGSGSNVISALLGTYATTGNSTCRVTADGRGVFYYPAPNSVLSILLNALGLGGEPAAPRVYYLVGPNHGYFVETGYAGLGKFEAQSTTAFSASQVNGNFVFGSTPASSVANINSVGTFTSTGNGQVALTQTLNIGVGTVNVLSLGGTVTNPISGLNTTTGRFMLGTDVVYMISPGRFVLVDSSLTSPTTYLAY